MPRYTTAEEALAALPKALPWAYAIGALPKAPDDSVVWIKPLTLDQAIRVHVMEAERFRKKPAQIPSLEQRQRLILQRCLFRNPEQWRLNGSGKPTCDPDKLVPLFAAADATARLGDPTMEGNCAWGFVNAILTASLWPEPSVLAELNTAEEAEEAGDDYDGWAAGGADNGQWVPDLWPGGEVYIKPFDEATRDLSSMFARCNDLGLSADVPWRSDPCLVAASVLSGPNGTPLFTQEQVRALPLGLAHALAWVANRLIPSGGWGIAARFPTTDALAAPDGGTGLPAVVVGGEGGHVAEFPDGDLPVASDGVDGELQPDADADQQGAAEGV